MVEEKKKTKAKKNIAKKNFVICQNDYYCEIKEGDDLDKLNIPEKYLINLKTEEVL